MAEFQIVLTNRMNRLIQLQNETRLTQEQADRKLEESLLLGNELQDLVQNQIRIVNEQQHNQHQQHHHPGDHHHHQQQQQLDKLRTVETMCHANQMQIIEQSKDHAKTAQRTNAVGTALAATRMLIQDIVNE